MRNGFQSGMVKHASAAIRRGNILVGAIIALCIAAGACDPDVVQGSGGASNGISSGTGINGRRRTTDSRPRGVLHRRSATSVRRFRHHGAVVDRPVSVYYDAAV